MNWISWVLRTKNWSDFLMDVVESFVWELDELIIINNKSSDNTKIICEKLIKKYWDKIKYYEYNYDILREENKKTNSIHSFAYYSNWSISKANYKTIFKVDDDNLFIQDIFKQHIQTVRKILKKSSKIFCFYWWLNYYKKEWKIWVVEDNPYSWRFGDIWFFNISPKTYFIQKWTSEVLMNNYFYYDLWFSYIHMKYFKKNNWLSYSPKNNIVYYKNLLEQTNLIDANRYVNKVSHHNIIVNIKKIL